MSEPPNFSCEHVTWVLRAFVEVLERTSDVQNSLAMESDSRYQVLMSQQLFRALQRGCEELADFLNDHDPEVAVRRPQLVLLPPAEQL